MRRTRLSVVMTHPIQYYAPWFRYIAANCPSIELMVHYCIIPTPQQQGVGFKATFSWDSSLLEGYDHVTLREPPRKASIHSSSFFGVNVPEVGASVKAFRPDVVLVPGWYSISLVRAALGARFARVPVLYRGDTQFESGSSGTRVARRARTRAALHLFTHYLSVGCRNREYLRRSGIPESRIFFAPHAVDNDFFSSSANAVRATEERKRARGELGIASDAFVVLFAGKLEQKKRPWEVIEAAHELGDSTHVLIVGSGELEDRCRLESQRGAATTSFLGFRNQTEIGRLYGVADCLVLPSDWGETWGLVVNEAMAGGIPCVVSDRVGCGPDLVEPGITGYITPFGHATAIAGALGGIRRSLRAGHDFSRACRERIANYSFETATAGLEQALASATSQR